MILIRRGGLPLEAWNALGGANSGLARLEQRRALTMTQLQAAFEAALAQLPESPLRTRVYNARKAFFQRGKLPPEKEQVAFEASGTLESLCAALKEAIALEVMTAEQDQKWEQILLENYDVLQKVALREDFQRMLLFASHDLLQALPAFGTKAPLHFGKKDRQVALSVWQYLTRASFKTSPLGRFTTVQVKAFETLNQELDFPQLEKAVVSPNVVLLPVIYEILIREAPFFSALELRLNPSLCLSPGGQLQWLYFDGESEAFQETQADAVTQWVVDFFCETESRQMPYAALLKALSGTVEAEVPALQHFVFRLVDLGLLEWVWPETGMSSGWCGNLLQFLARLPQTPVLTEAAMLLQWLRTAARTLPFQSVAAVSATQVEALQRCRDFVDQHDLTLPPVPAEQIFFEDVMRDASVALPRHALQHSVEQLSELWRKAALVRLPEFRQKLWRYTELNVPPEGVPFMAFCRDFLEQYAHIQPLEKHGVDDRTQVYRARNNIGALLQFYKENGTYKAVVNALYPGSGKLFARWAPFFPPEMAERFQEIYSGGLADTEVAFPWQSWTNANFQPETRKTALLAPGGRLPVPKGKRRILLSELVVKPDALGMPVLHEGRDGTPVSISDLGLEAPEGRPPAMQVLWHLGVPWVSLGALMPETAVWEDRNGVQYRKRVEYQSLVLARESWILTREQYAGLFDGITQAVQVRHAYRKWTGWGIPSRFFAQLMGERSKPQFFDLHIPISMVLLEKTLRNAQGRLWITEMLPAPEFWVEEEASEINVLIC